VAVLTRGAGRRAIVEVASRGYPLAMAPRRDPEREFVASRMGLLARVQGELRVSEETAERWLAAWDAEARSRGLDARSTWFDGAYEWIAEQRRELR
jgi:hypothetical protein